MQNCGTFVASAHGERNGERTAFAVKEIEIEVDNAPTNDQVRIYGVQPIKECVEQGRFVRTIAQGVALVFHVFARTDHEDGCLRLVGGRWHTCTCDRVKLIGIPTCLNVD